jgi:hypothetical protein
MQEHRSTLINATHLTRLRLNGATARDSDAIPTVELTYAHAGATHGVALVWDADDRAWRGTIDRRERLHCAIPLDATLTSIYTLAVAEGSKRISVTCATSLEGISAEATVASPLRRGLAGPLAAARASALSRLADAVTKEIDGCDARFRAMVDGETRWTTSDDAIFVPPPLVNGSRDSQSGRGSYTHSNGHSSARMVAASARARDTGYLAMPGLARSGARAMLGTYGSPARSIGHLANGYMPDESSAAAERGTQVESLGFTLLRLQSLLTALESVELSDA